MNPRRAAQTAAVAAAVVGAASQDPEVGELVLTVLFPHGVYGGFRVDRADERIVIAPTSLTQGEIAAGAFVVHAVNGTWRYRIVGPAAGGTGLLLAELDAVDSPCGPVHLGGKPRDGGR